MDRIEADMILAKLATDHPNMPRHLADSLLEYAVDRRETGGFLRACLENNLMGACLRADLENQRRLHDICIFIYNELPQKCWGSDNVVRLWINGT